MKRVTQAICLILIFSITLTTPAFAAETATRASNYFMSYSHYLWKVSDTHFQVWFEVAAVRTMDELGASEVKVQRSSDGVNWETVQTYSMADYPDMICNSTVSHSSCVDYYDAQPGYYYRGRVDYYAKRGTGSATNTKYTSTITMP